MSSKLSVAVLGAGNVGRTLAAGWLEAGHEVVLGSREPDAARMRATLGELEEETGVTVRALAHAEAAAAADAVVVAVPGNQVSGLLEQLGDALRGKVAIDATNTVAPDRPLDSLALLAGSGAHAFRAYTIYGWEQMERPEFGDLRADLFYTGPDEPAAAHEAVRQLITDTGFRPIHLGDGAEAVTALNSLTLLWFRLAFERGYGRRVALRLLTEQDEGDE